MRYSFLLAVLFFSSSAMALLRFEAKTYTLQGKILVSDRISFLAINYGTNAETRIRLTGTIPPKLLTQSGSNAVVTIRVEKPFFSVTGDAELLKITRYLNPFEPVKTYNSETELIQR